MTQIQNRILKLLEEHLGLEGLKPNDILTNLGMDSLDVAHFEVKVESEYGIIQTSSWANKDDTIERIGYRFEKIYLAQEQERKLKGL